MNSCAGTTATARTSRERKTRRLSATLLRPGRPVSRAAGGSRFLADPDVDASHQDVFWRPEADPQVVTLVASHLPDSGIAFEPDNWPGELRIRRAADAVYAALTVDDREHRILLPRLEAAGFRVAAAIPLDDDAPLRAEATLRLWRELARRPARDGPSIPSNRRARLAAALRALDGNRDGASYRAIAEALFGRARVDSEIWKTSSLRDATIRLVRTGLALARDGYRRLLRLR